MKHTAEFLCHTGELVLTTENERYIRNENFLFPCIKTEDNDKVYIIKTILTKEMAVKPL